MLAWQCYHLEVTDNAAPGEPGHLHDHVLHLLGDVALAVKIGLAKFYNVQLNVDHVEYGTISKKHLNFRGDHDYVNKGHLSNIPLRSSSMVFANASNSGLSGSLRLGFHSLTCGFVADTLGWLTLFFWNFHVNSPS